MATAESAAPRPPAPPRRPATPKSVGADSARPPPAMTNPASATRECCAVAETISPTAAATPAKSIRVATGGPSTLCDSNLPLAIAAAKRPGPRPLIAGPESSVRSRNNALQPSSPLSTRNATASTPPTTLRRLGRRGQREVEQGGQQHEHRDAAEDPRRMGARAPQEPRADAAAENADGEACVQPVHDTHAMARFDRR